ncbi:HSF-type DNA-binding-domain-containing protein, partial [Spinellus fusiger]
RILNNQDHQQLISWTPSGSQFCVHDIEQFSSQILPLYFKHSNWPSFVRQLNMYGFHKVGSLHTTSTTNERQHNGLMCKFKHIDFQRDQPSLLQHIRRK